MGFLVAAGVVALLAILPLGVSALYHADGACVTLIIGPMRMALYPPRKKEKPPKKTEEPPEEKPDKRKTGQSAHKTGGDIRQFWPLVEVALDFLGDFRRKLRVNNLELNLILAGDDPCDLGLNYGRAWAAVGNLIPRLEQLFVIKKRSVQVQCDFTSERTLIYAALDVTITLGRLLYLVVRYGIRALREYLNIKNKSKGGAKL